MLSRRLKALVMPTTQRSVSRMSTTGILVSRSTRSAWTRTPVRTICATSLTGGRTGRMSSTSPTAPIARDARTRVRSRPLRDARPGHCRHDRHHDGDAAEDAAPDDGASDPREAASRARTGRPPARSQAWPGDQGRTRVPNAAGALLTTAPRPPWRAGAPRRGRPHRRPAGSPRRSAAPVRALPCRAPDGARDRCRRAISASASASGSPGATRRPVTPSSTRSGTPPTRVATTGRSAAIASMSDTGEPSFREVSATTQASA